MIVAFSVSPIGADESVADAVADAVRVVRDSGLPHRTDPMFTTIEGSWDDVMDVIRQACEAVQRHGPRVSLVLKADIRPGHDNAIEEKVRAIEERLGAGS